MKVFVALLLLSAGALWAYGYGMMGYGMMGGPAGYPGGGAGELWGYMSAMHNYMHGTNYTTDQFRAAMQGDGSPRGGMMDGYNGSEVSGWGCPMMDGDEGYGPAVAGDDDAAPQPAASAGTGAPQGWFGWMYSMMR